MGIAWPILQQRYAPVHAIDSERPLEVLKTQIVILVLVHFGLIK